MITLTTVFKSEFMPEDKLITKGETLEDCKRQYFDWWRSYGKDEEYAIKQVIRTDVNEIY